MRTCIGVDVGGTFTDPIFFDEEASEVVVGMGEPPPGALEERDSTHREAAAASGARHADGFAEPFAYGSDERIRDEIAQDFAALDIDRVDVRFYLKGVDHPTVVDQIERFGGAVLSWR
jgi:hypothetical protein